MENKYYLWLNIRRNIEDTEEDIENILGPCAGSGAGFGSRDLSYYFNSINSLYSAVKKVRSLPRQIKCRAYEGKQ